MNVIRKTDVVIVRQFVRTQMGPIHAAAKMLATAGQVRDVKILMSVRMELTNVMRLLRNAGTKKGAIPARVSRVTRRKKINVLVGDLNYREEGG